MVRRTRSGKIKPGPVHTPVPSKTAVSELGRKITRSVTAKSGAIGSEKEHRRVHATYSRPWFTIHGLSNPKQEEGANDGPAIAPKNGGSNRKGRKNAARMTSHQSESVIEVHRPPSKVVDDRLAGRNGSTSEHYDDRTPSKPEAAIASEVVTAPTAVSTWGVTDSIYPPNGGMTAATNVVEEFEAGGAPNYPNSPISEETFKPKPATPSLHEEQLETQVECMEPAGQEDNEAATDPANLRSYSEERYRRPSRPYTPEKTDLPATPDSSIAQTLDISLPGPYLSRSCSPASSLSGAGSPAARILKTQFRPIPSPTKFTSVLTRKPPSELSSSELYELALRTQEALVAWQTEYLALDRRTAPHALPIPKKPATGGRIPLPRAVHQDMLEADLYGYTFDPKKIGHQDPWAQRSGRVNGEARDLRRRRGEPERLVAMLGISEDDAGAKGSGPEHRKRMRQPIQRYEGVNLNSTPRKRRHARPLKSETPEPELNRPGSGRKRPLAGKGYLSQRVRQMRAESGLTATTAEDEEEEMERSPSSRNPQLDGRSSKACVKKMPRRAKPTAAKSRVKSEKRSQSMTIWWAERKRKATEEKMKVLGEQQAEENGSGQRGQPKNRRLPWLEEENDEIIEGSKRSDGALGSNKRLIEDDGWRPG